MRVGDVNAGCDVGLTTSFGHGIVHINTTCGIMTHTTSVAQRRRRRERLERRVAAYRKRATVGRVFPRLAFARLSREVLRSHGRQYLMSVRACRALQCAAESYLDNLFGHTEQLLAYVGAETLTPREMQLALYFDRSALCPPKLNAAMGTDDISADNVDDGYVIVDDVTCRS